MEHSIIQSKQLLILDRKIDWNFPRSYISGGDIHQVPSTIIITLVGWLVGGGTFFAIFAAVCVMNTIRVRRRHSDPVRGHVTLKIVDPGIVQGREDNSTRFEWGLPSFPPPTVFN